METFLIRPFSHLVLECYNGLGQSNIFKPHLMKEIVKMLKLKHASPIHNISFNGSNPASFVYFRSYFLH